MGQGEEKKTRPEPTVEIQERGEIFFFYRPKVNREGAHGAEDVQRLYLVLRPAETQGASSSGGSEEKQGDTRHSEEGGSGVGKVNQQQPGRLLRYIVMGRKSLPQRSSHNATRPYWGFVDMVTTEVEHVKAALRGEEYETATRGHRHLPDARAVGEGVYRILRHIKSPTGRNMHTHLIYKLEYPAEGEEEEPQEALNIAREASFIIQIKNPEAGASSGFRGLQPKRKAAFPAHLQGLLGHLRFHPADPPDFLNYEGCEFLLISASTDIEEELGLELETEPAVDEECSDLLKTFGVTVPDSTRPLFKGTWL